MKPKSNIYTAISAIGLILLSLSQILMSFGYEGYDGIAISIVK